MDYTARTPAQLGKILRGQRKATKLSQAEAGATVGLLPKTISRLELDTETATVESLYKLLSALHLEIVVRSKSGDASLREW